MRNKILTVDDSKTVRIIVKKVFRDFDCEVLEAANGVEGLAMASKHVPDLILLDVTMPVMDGVEMLTKLKSDAALKAIPVMMLTAEGGREQVLKIAKIGVRDYIVKPFKEDVLLDKVNRIIEMRPAGEAPDKTKSINDSADILVVELAQAIIDQIKDGLKHTPWKVNGVQTIGEAIDFCARSNVDLIMLGLNLPMEAAFNLFRMLRAGTKTKSTPIFGLVVKTETGLQQQAQNTGFNGIITKPIDFNELEAKAAKAMNLDTSTRYFSVNKDHLLITLPETLSNLAVLEINQYLKKKASEAVEVGMNKAIIDAHKLANCDMVSIKMLMDAMQVCNDLSMRNALVGNPRLSTEAKGFEDTKNWVFHESIDAAMASMVKTPLVALAT
ncbi:MAG: response regulator [Verrucomicrobiota bacterium]|nr:response regulator [Verrucomicrobiota bacterium]